jgi:Uma2 family endonuclease
MTTIEVLTTPGIPDTREPDPFRYGWRYVRQELPDGSAAIVQEPLTLEDVLHPREGDQVTHSDAHQRRRRYLCNVFEAQLSADPTAVVLDDVRIAWDLPDLKPHGPDIMVILGVRERRNWSTFDVAVEGVRPKLIVEITLPETAAIDRSNKLEEYDLAGVPLYVIVDSVLPHNRPALRLLGYTRTEQGYQVLAPDAQGRLWLEPVRIWLGVVANELVCFSETGQPLGDYQALAAALADEVAARTAAEQRAAAAEARLQALEAELRHLRGDMPAEQ